MLIPGCKNRVPSSGSVRPERIFKRVDFPEPFRPTRAILSPAEIEISSFLNNSSPPNPSVKLFNVSHGWPKNYPHFKKIQ